MTTHTSLLDLTNQLIHDDSARSAFAEDPDGFLAGHGISDLSPVDVADGLGHVADALPPHLAVQLSPADAYDGSAATLVDQFRVVSDVDADYTLPELDLDDDVDVQLVPALDIDPHGAIDDAPVETGDTPEASDDPDPGDGDGEPVDGPDAGFGSGGDDPASQLDTPTGGDGDGVDVDDDLGGFEVAVPDFEDPAAFDDSSVSFDDSFLAPEPVDAEPGEADDLDADNGNWDGAWNHDDGHGML